MRERRPEVKGVRKRDVSLQKNDRINNDDFRNKKIIQ